MAAADERGEQPPESIHWLGPLIDRFDDAWQAGRVPEIEEYLQAAGGHRQAALVELVHVDLERRLKAGEAARVESYLARFPELVDDASAVLELIGAEYYHRRRREPGLTAEEYQRRFPQYEKQLPGCLERPPYPAGRPAEPEPEPSNASSRAARREPAGTAPSRDTATGGLTPRRSAELPGLPTTHLGPEMVFPPSPGSWSERSNPQPTPMPDAALTEDPATQAPGVADATPAWASVEGYEILGVLGRGGMGVVYKARHQALKRLVALKMVLVGAHAAPEVLARFRKEAEAVARLHHPNIVQIYDVGEQDGLPYLSLEYVEGTTLHRRLAEGPLPPDEAGRLVETLARTIHYAHQRGIIHRDLKPANILLQSVARSPEPVAGSPGEPSPGGMDYGPRATDYGLPKVTDFGLAKQLDGAESQTRTGAILGTPSYMAPEQASGKRGKVGPATDVYALGAILYHALTGRPPFKAETPLDTVMQVLSEEPTPPGKLVPVPARLEAICLKCLRKQPGERYASAERLAEALRAWTTGCEAYTPADGTRVPVAGGRTIAKAKRRWVYRVPFLLIVVTGLGWIQHRTELGHMLPDAGRWMQQYLWLPSVFLTGYVIFKTLQRWLGISIGQITIRLNLAYVIFLNDRARFLS